MPANSKKTIVSNVAEILERFGAIVTPIYEQVDVLFRQIQNLRRTHDLLLPRLQSGQLELRTAVPHMQGAIAVKNDR